MKIKIHKMKDLKLTIAVFLSLFVVFSSCQKEEMIDSQSDTGVQTESKGKIVLGQQIENPYSIENMKKAYESLRSQGQLKSASITEDVIEPTHLYVRFLPVDSIELNVLTRDTTLELFDYPLDYNIEEEGFYYHDPEIPEDRPTWQYTAVPIDYEFPNVKYEIIEECFIPEDSIETELKSTGESDFLALLEHESFRLTGNLDAEFEQESNLKSEKWGLPSKKEPKGTIRVHNTIAGLDGVMRVKVRVHRAVKIKSAYTNTSGYYHIKKGFRYKVHYAVIFENASGFKIWGNWAFTAPAHYNMGWHSKSGHNRDIYRNSGAWKWATVNNAVHKYRDYCNTFSISKPPSNMRVWVFEKSDGSTMGSASMLRRTWGLYGFTSKSKLGNFFLKTNGINLSVNTLTLITKFAQPDLTISVNSNKVGTDDVYNTTFHECAHASHWTKVGSSYWVKYINYIITYGAYGNGTGQNAGYCGVGEMWGNYIGAMLERREFSRSNWNDLNHGEDWYNPGFLRHVNDISDVTTSEIFSCMTSSTNTIDKMVSKLKTKTNHDAQVDAAYNLYSDWP
jgi:hypothetical protein